MVSARREALAWGDADDGDDAHRHSGSARRQGRRLDGTGARRAIPEVRRLSVTGRLFTATQRAMETWRRLWKPLIIVLPWTAIVLAVLYIVYRLVDPLPPHHLALAAGAAGSGYDNVARQYGRILARDGVELEVRNAAGAVENLALLRDPASGVQAALTTFGIT